MSLTAIAYTIGGGIAVSGTSTMLGLLAAGRAAGAAGRALVSEVRATSLPQLPQMPNYSVGVPQRALPAPPPPPAPLMLR